MRRIAALAIAGAVLLTGCGSGPGADEPGPSVGASVEASVEATGEQSVEATGEPVPVDGQPVAPADSTPVPSAPSEPAASVPTSAPSEPTGPVITEAEVAEIERQIEEIDTYLTDLELEMEQD